MLQIAGLAAIINEINPGLGDKIAHIFTEKVNTHLVKPFEKTYKHGLINGLGIGFTSGIIMTYTCYKIYKKIYDLKITSNILKDRNGVS